MIVQHFEKNTLGRDFVIGDLHGCYSDFEYVLSELNFDKSKDRMFSVGDLVDRGSNSLKCLSLLDEPWFFAVIGNHELMMYDSVCGYDDNSKTFLLKNGWNARMWLSNGGDWIDDKNQMCNMTNDIIQKHLSNIKNMPSIIRIHGYNKKINITHAELYSNIIDLTDDFIDNLDALENNKESSHELLEIINNVKQSCAWGRRIVKNAINPDAFDIEDLTLLDQVVICGHNVVDNPSTYKNHIFIDGGACFASNNMFERKLIVYNIQEEKTHVFKLKNDAIGLIGYTW